MSGLIKKLILIFGGVVLFLFLAFIGAAMYMGAFASVNITNETSGPYYFVYVDNQGLYQKIAGKIDEVHSYLQDKPVEITHAAAMYLDDPNRIRPSDLRSRGGWLVSDSVFVSEPYRFIRIPQHTVAIARVHAHPAVAPFKTYPALSDWLEHHKLQQDSSYAALEIYYASGIVEVEMPVIPE